MSRKKPAKAEAKTNALTASLIPVLFVGPPGVGKTETTLQEFDHVEVLLLSSANEETIGGLPYREGELERYTRPEWLEKLWAAYEAGLTTCLFLDEMDKARREVADTLLTLVASRRIGKNALPPTTVIRGAANPPEWDGGDGISKPMISRFSVQEFIVDVPRWAAVMKERHGDHEGALRVIEKFESGIYPIMDSTGEGFSYRLTCPRTINFALTALKEGQTHLINGLVTAGTLTAFLSEIKGQEVVSSDWSGLLKSANVAESLLKSRKNRRPVHL